MFYSLYTVSSVLGNFIVMNTVVDELFIFINKIYELFLLLEVLAVFSHKEDGGIR